MNESIVIRAAIPSDAQSIALVHVESWRSTYAGILPASYLEQLSIERRKAMWVEVINSRKLGCHELVAEAADGKIIGFVSGGPNRDRKPAVDHDESHADEPDGEIYALYLLATHQKSGLGKRLLLNSLQRMQADGFYACKVWVLEGNPASGFYQKLGAVRAGEKMVQIGESAYLESDYRWRDLEKGIQAQIPGFRHGAIKHLSECQDPDRPAYPGSEELLSIGSPFSRFFDFARLGIHHEILPPGRRTSWPHAESMEDEFAFVIEGNPDV